MKKTEYEKLGELYAERGDKEKAVAEWFRITKSAPGQYSRHQMLAGILKSHGFYDQAAAEYRKAIKLQPQLSHLYMELANVYVVKKQFDSVIDVYLDALMRFPINHPGRSEITTAMLELCDLEGLYGKVISRLKAHLKGIRDQSPGDRGTLIPSYLTLADVYFHQGNLDSSLQQFRTIASLYPDRGGTLFDRAQTLEREGQFSHAIKFYRTVLDLFPNTDTSLHALMCIGQLRARLHQPQAAIASLRMLISQVSNNKNVEAQHAVPLQLNAYITIGDVYLQQMHDAQTALSTYTKAKREKLEAESREQRAKSEELRTLSSMPYALSSKLYTLSPFPDLDLKIAECYRLMGQYDMAENILDSIPTESRSRSIPAQVAKLRGDCYFSRGDFDNALIQYQEAIRGYMNEDWVNDALDTVALIKEYSEQGLRSLLGVHAQVERLRKLGQYDDALALYASAEYTTDRIKLEIGDLLALQMKAKEAISAYEELVRSNSPMAPEAQFRIAEIYWQQLEDPKQAIERYSALIENYPDSVLVADARKQIRLLASEEVLSDSLP